MGGNNKALGAKTKSATTQSVARRRRRHKCQNSEKILAILTITAFILSVAPILFHSYNSSSELHTNASLKGSLGNFVQQKSASSAANIQDTSLEKRKKGQHELHNNHPVAHLNCVDHGGPTDPDIIDEMVYWVSFLQVVSFPTLFDGNCITFSLNTCVYYTYSRIYPPMQTIYHHTTPKTTHTHQMTPKNSSHLNQIRE